MIRPAKFAVALFVLRENTEVEMGWECILVARKDNHSRWGLPGGKVDPGETSPMAAHRELYEETGVDLGYYLSENRLLRDMSRLIPQETVLDSGGYFTTFYLVDTTGMAFPSEFDVANHEAPVRWGPVYELLSGPFDEENAARLRKIGIFP